SLAWQWTSRTSSSRRSTDVRLGALPRPFGPDDPHREELRAAAVRLRQRLAGTVDLVLARTAADLLGRLGKPDHPGRADRVARQHAAAHVHREAAAQLGRAVLDHLPALARGRDPVALQPHRLEP